MKKITFKKPEKDAASRKKTRLGGYSVALICIVLALLVAVNLIAGELPSKYTKIDVSELQLFSLSEDNISYLKELDRDVTLYLITENGTDNNDMYEILTKYAAENSHISVVVKDPSLYPNFTAQYTDAALTDCSVIVESGDKSKVIDFQEIFALDYNAYYSTGQAAYNYNGESLISGAIDYVTREDLPMLYVISGHGEAALSDTMRKSLEAKNYTVNDLALISAAEVPADCDVLLMDSPTQDISAEEAQLLLSYLEKGGRFLLFTGASAKTFPNLNSVMETYGMTAHNGIVMDSNADNHYQSYLMLLPDKISHEITAAQINEGTYTLFPIAHGLSKLEQYRSTLTVSPLLETSKDAYLKNDPETIETLEKEAGDMEGKFCLGIAAEEDYNGVKTRVVWYSSALTNIEYYDTAVVSGANSKLILSTFDWLNGGETTGVNIPAKSMTSEASMVLSAGQSIVWVFIMVILIPLCLLIFGLVYWLRRRKR